MVDGTYAAVVDFIAWSIEVLATGKYPSQGPRGEALPPNRAAKARSWLADGWTCHFVGWQGDLKEKLQCHGFKRNYLANALCEWCLATRVSTGRMNAYDFRVGAKWRRTPTTHEEYLRTTGLARLIFNACMRDRQEGEGTNRGSTHPTGPEIAPRPRWLSPWVQVPKWNIHRNLLDSLHLIWLGIGKDVAGSMAVVLASMYGGSAPCLHPDNHGGSPLWKLQEAFSELWHEYDAWCSRTGATFAFSNAPACQRRCALEFASRTHASTPRPQCSHASAERTPTQIFAGMPAPSTSPTCVRTRHVRSFKAFTPSLFHCKDAGARYPVLQQTVKGLPCKVLIKFLCDWTVQCVDDGKDTRPDAQDRRALAVAFRSYIDILDNAGMFLTPCEARSARLAGESFLLAYQKLACQALPAGPLLWRMRPKWHYMCHQVANLEATRENPSKMDLCAAETYMGRIKLIASKCHGKTITRRVAERLALHSSLVIGGGTLMGHMQGAHMPEAAME